MVYVVVDHVRSKGVNMDIDLSGIDQFVIDNTAWLLMLTVLGVVILTFFAPLIAYKTHKLRKLRQFWKYQAMVGWHMSKRQRDIYIAKRAYDMLLDAIAAKEITHKDKRQYLRRLEIALDLEPGVLRPKPTGMEIKSRIRRRLIRPVTTKVERNKNYLSILKG
jgi:hypothetical protein